MLGLWNILAIHLLVVTTSMCRSRLMWSKWISRKVQRYFAKSHLHFFMTSSDPCRWIARQSKTNNEQFAFRRVLPQGTLGCSDVIKLGWSDSIGNRDTEMICANVQWGVWNSLYIWEWCLRGKKKISMIFYVKISIINTYGSWTCTVKRKYQFTQRACWPSRKLLQNENTTWYFDYL